MSSMLYQKSKKTRKLDFGQPRKGAMERLEGVWRQ
jgi:hypothetical protein